MRIWEVQAKRKPAHIATISKAYRNRLALLTQFLTDRLGSRLHLSTPEGSLKLVVGIPELADDGPLRESLIASGFAMSLLSDYFISPP